MGDRVSISFVNGESESVALFNHWAGPDLPEMARQYVAGLEADIATYDPRGTYPLGRFEPNTVMIDFIRWLAERGDLAALAATSDVRRVWRTWYLGRDSDDGDNSDNGHFRIEVGRAP